MTLNFILNSFIQVAKINLENTLHTIDNEIQSNRRICEDKQAFHEIAKVQKSLDKLDVLLLEQVDCNIVTLTRAVAEYNHLVSSLTKCKRVIKPVHLKVIFLNLQNSYHL